MEEAEFDEFEAMEAEAEALAASAKNVPMPQRAPGQKPVPIKAIVKPGQPNPNIAPNPMRPQSQQSQPQQQQRPAGRPQAPPPQPQQHQEAQPLWVAYYQAESIGVVNTQTGERMESTKDDPATLMAQVMARMLNDLNTVIIAGGYE